MTDAEIATLRDYLLSHGMEESFNDKSMRALIYDLNKNGMQRNLKHNAHYDDMKAMYQELKPRFNEVHREIGLAPSQTRVPSSLEDADNLVANHQAVQAEQLPVEGDQLSHGYGNRSMQANEIIAKANEKFKTSKARDENGNLKVLYQGTTSDFDMNKASNGNFGKGFYFVEDIEKVNKHFVKGVRSNIMPVVLDIENPFNIDDHAVAMPVVSCGVK